MLNRPEHAGARILVAGPNFGVGSSREHAVWALVDSEPGRLVFVANPLGKPRVRPGNGYDAFEWVDIATALDRCNALVSATLDLVA